ncbi:hypothetical protein IU449_01270 [Nocardia higoensis]|uniref:SRPBCC family protein n=1 Tax=Nocardia higoensis TaxID=228599 RepID=A0ABS0D3X2_9NOCA|nr:hypothetical protein [Nocardia higoensis]MBF6353191.1 hypothetical protein [Nocardia higoensis]
MNETGVYEITVADRALSELINAVHDVAERPARPSERGWAARDVAIRDFPDVGAQGRAQRRPRENRPIAEVIVEADGIVRVDVRFVLAGGAATARFDTGCDTTGTLDTMRPASFARYLMTATMAALTVRGVRAELVRHIATA